jgi:predicted porin
MKKSLVALAAFAAVSSFAQSSVTIYGNLDQSFYRETNAGRVAYTGNGNNNNTTSLWGLTGSEDLGGGLKANFDLKSEISLMAGQVGSTTTSVGSNSISLPGVSAQTAGSPAVAQTAASASVVNVGEKTSFFNRSAYLELASNTWGSVRGGRQNDLWWEVQGLYNNSGSNSFGFGNATSIQNTSALSTVVGSANVNSAITTALGGAQTTGYGTTKSNPLYQGTSVAFVGGFSYRTPVINGLQGGYQVSSGKPEYAVGAGVNSGSAYFITYNNGPLKVSYAANERKLADEQVGWKNAMLGGTYQLGAFTFILAQNKTTFAGLAAGSHGMTATGYGLNYNFGNNWDANLAYTTTKDDADSANKFTQTAATARYAFSKRTNAYFGLARGANSGLSAQNPVYAGPSGTVAGTTTNVLMTGIRHQF